MVFIALLCLSCKKNVNELSSAGEAQVLVTLASAEFDYEDNVGSVSSGNQSSAAQMAKSPSAETKNTAQQTFTLPFSDEITVFGTLQELSAGGSEANTPTTELKRASAGKAAIQRNPLAPGTQYLIAVYSAAGQFVAQNTYISGRESETAAFLLDGGSTYTFIGLSFNTQNTVPTIVYTNPNVRTLNTASVTATTQDLMVFKTSVAVVSGNNTLSVVLRHIFTEITTNLIIDPTVGGTITSVNSADIRPTRTGATYSLATEAITYAALSSTGQTVAFPAIPTGGTKRLSSTPTRLLSPAVSNGVLTLRNLTVNGTAKAEFLVPDLAISPGKKYNLNLNFRVPCTQDVNNTVFDVRDGNFRDFTVSGANYGFILDIYTLDNSFNMTINGTRIGSNEIQFQASGAGSPRNIQFADGALWGLGGVPEIYDLIGNEASPIIRVTVSAAGQVSLEGRKSISGPLLPLTTIPGGNLTLANTTWNTTGSNTIRVTQIVSGPTLITGRGRGRQIITCPN
ncbi:hypothetical protein B0I21_105320 [Sphingobacterium paludis]|uniref:Uncharacterized protein n=2 Tax=Sphingobacterium paludis TaxID=1476465 RepID=A0A4R7D2Z2_9SPHI|nr:hypothetical protein B0I21_105320 [Sphingobacterium paludis]